MSVPLNQEAWPTDHFAQDLKCMAQTITRLELWEWFRTESPPADKGYSWWSHENVNKIASGLPHNPHSGASFACAMRNMQCIAKDGFSEWKAQYIN